MSNRKILYTKDKDKKEFIVLELRKKHLEFIPLENEEQLDIVFDLFCDGLIPSEEQFKRCKTGVLELYTSIYCWFGSFHRKSRDFLERAQSKDHPVSFFVSFALNAAKHGISYIDRNLSHEESVKKLREKYLKILEFGNNLRVYRFFSTLARDPKDHDALFRCAEEMYIVSCQWCLRIDKERTLKIIDQKIKEGHPEAGYVWRKVYPLPRGGPDLDVYYQNVEELFGKFFDILILKRAFWVYDSIELVYQHRRGLSYVSIHEIILKNFPGLSGKSICRMRHIFEDSSFFDFRALEGCPHEFLVKEYREGYKLRRLMELQNLHIAVVSQNQKYPKIYPEIYKEIFDRS